METTIYNSAQQQLLEVMSFIKTDKALEDMNAALADYFAKQIDDEMDRLWDEGVINDETIKQWSKEHMRTPYR